MTRTNIPRTNIHRLKFTQTQERNNERPDFYARYCHTGSGLALISLGAVGGTALSTSRYPAILCLLDPHSALVICHFRVHLECKVYQALEMTTPNPTEQVTDTARTEKQASIKSERLKILRSWATFVVFGAIIYFGNVELQSYLGRKAVENTGLAALDLSTALMLAKQQDKLVVADMSAIWCSNCRRLDKDIFSNPLVQETLESHFIFTRIEYESEAGEEFMGIYSVRGFPTVLVLNPDGSMRQKLPLTFNAESYNNNLRAAL